MAGTGYVPREITDALSEFRGMLTTIRAKQAEYDVALKKGRADPLVLAAINRMEGDLNALHRKANRQSSGRVLASADTPTDMLVKADREFEHWKGVLETGVRRSRVEYSKAFDHYLRREKDALDPMELKTLAAGSSPDGGFFIEPYRARTMILKLYESSDVRRVAPAVEIAKNAYEEPIDRQLVGSGWVGEQSSRPETTTPQIGLFSVPVHEQYALVRTTQNFLDDAGIDVQTWLDEKVAEQFSMQENGGFVTGNGESKPTGFLTYPTSTAADASRAFGTLQYKFTGSSGAFRTASASVSPADDLLDLIYSFKSGFRKNLRWAGTRTTLGAIRKFKDQQGNFIYDPRLGQNGIIDTVLGYEWDEFADMSDFTVADAMGVALADWKKGYLIVDRQGIRQLRDPYTVKGAVLFYTTKRVGGAVRDSDALKFLKFGTS
jgi:HK97 family phage major capsid protein